MKTSIRLLFLLSVLFTNAAVFAQNRAVKITLIDARPSLDETLLKNIHQTVGTGVTSGIIANFVSYNHPDNLKNRWVACAELNANTSKAQFAHLLSSLNTLKPRSSASYEVKVTDECVKDNTLVCRDNPVSCLPKTVFDGAYQEFVAREQFAAGLADISRGNTLMSFHLSEGNSTVDLSNPASVRLPTASKNCSQIATTGDVITGEATIACVLKGNAAVNGKVITLTRWEWYEGGWVWYCDSDLDVNAKQLFAGKCNGDH